LNFARLLINLRSPLSLYLGIYGFSIIHHGQTGQKDGRCFYTGFKVILKVQKISHSAGWLSHKQNLVNFQFATLSIEISIEEDTEHIIVLLH
jgi:hypothetical protein